MLFRNIDPYSLSIKQRQTLLVTYELVNALGFATETTITFAYKHAAVDSSKSRVPLSLSMEALLTQSLTEERGPYCYPPLSLESVSL